MADIDTERRGIRVDDQEFAVLALHMQHDTEAPVVAPEVPADLVPTSDYLAELGAIVDDALAPFVQKIMSVLAAPQLEFHIEVVVISGVSYFMTVALSGEGAVFRRSTDDDRTELLAVDLDMVIPEILRCVGMSGPRPDPGWESPIVVPAQVLHDLAAGRSEVDPMEGVAALVEAGLSDEEARNVVLVLMERRLTFRITAAWKRSPDDIQTRELTVVDGGKMGVWLSIADEQLTTATIVPTNPGGAARAIADMIPYEGFRAWN